MMKLVKISKLNYDIIVMLRFWGVKFA